MRELEREFPQYSFAKHKGYITKAHTEALQANGPCIEHRRSFANIAALL
jgi:ribonuclease HII